MMSEMTPLSPALAVIMQLLEVVLIGGVVSRMQMTRAIFCSWNVKVARVLELPAKVGVSYALEAQEQMELAVAYGLVGRLRSDNYPTHGFSNLYKLRNI